MSDFDPHRSPSRLGDFNVAGILGEGGSGTVYDARWGHREVALKVLKGEMTPGDRERFMFEARLLVEMTHPGVVKVLAAGSLPDGRPYLAMEKLPGESMARRLGRGPIALPQAITLFAQLCEAVSAMHARDLIHRDLKPENVMLVAGPTGTEHAVLLDFGIAKLASDGIAAPTQSGMVRGTPAYMAPERFFGHPASVSTDVYELAVTLFAMVSGRLPWADSADPEVRLNPVRLATVARVPQALDELVARALSTRAPNRPPTVAALCAEVIASAGADGAVARSTAAVRADASDPVAIPPRAAPDSIPPPNLATVRSSPGMEPWPAADRSTTGSSASGERAVLTTRTRRRWPLALVAGVAVAGGIAAVVVATRGEPAARRLVSGPEDPWSGEGPRPVIVVDAAEGDGGPVPEPLAPEERSAIRDQLAGSIRRHAPDIEGLIALSVAEMRHTRELAQVFPKVRAQPLLAGIIDSLIGSCDLAFGERASWMSLSLLPQFGIYDLVASGDWTREDIEQCTRGTEGTLKRKGARDELSVITGRPSGTRVLGWIDDHTFFVSNRLEANAAFVTARLAAPAETPSRIHELAAGIDRRASLWLVAGKRSLERAVEDPALRGADLTARFSLGDTDEDGEPAAAITVGMYFPDEPAAQTGLVAMEEMLSQLTDLPGFGLAMPEWTIRRDGTMVRVHGMIPDALIGKLQRVAIEKLP